MNRKVLVVMCCGWIVAVATGMKLLSDYANAPGSASLPPEQWPRESQIRLNREVPTLILFAHPRCPCTRATLEELDRFMASSVGRVAVFVAFVWPSGATGDCRETALWRRAKAIPGAHVLVDSGSETACFRVGTSGDAVMYDPQGRLVFHGGITDSRGHSGFNTGRATLERFVLTGRSLCSSTPVFGCPLGSGRAQDPLRQ